MSKPYAVAIDPSTAGWSWIITLVYKPRRSALPRLLSETARQIINRLNNLGLLRRFSAGRIYWTNNGDNSIRVPRSPAAAPSTPSTAVRAWE